MWKTPASRPVSAPGRRRGFPRRGVPPVSTGDGESHISTSAFLGAGR